ncbi:hypothetical protein LCGC14_0365010 [marine sediment metagenome]|uniref:Uncharacterized protein n=1 Tax=marine sediment metagenome TaxID=412755 RepID=A0A0F9TCS4_9ZZZZ
MEKTCLVDNCNGIVDAKELCGKHYRRLMRIGSVNLPKRTSKNLQTKEYRTWSAMKFRCSINSKGEDYHNYNKRGIRVCERWINSFDNFLKDMGKAPKGYQIDRIKNDGNYELYNCRWVPQKENSRNRRTNVLSYEIAEQMRVMEKHGITISEIAKSMGFNYYTVYNVINRGAWMR